MLTYTAQLTFIGQEMLRVDNGTGVVDQDTIDSLDEASQLINESSNAVDDLAADAGIDDFQDSFAQDGETMLRKSECDFFFISMLHAVLPKR